MIISYPDQEVISLKGVDSIYLAGFDFRGKKFKSWRQDAVNLLVELGYNGIIYVPEDRSGRYGPDRENQEDWEWNALEKAGKIIFWIPGKVNIVEPKLDLAEIATSLEYSYITTIASRSRKIFYGRENGLNTYFDNKFRNRRNKEPATSLRGLLELAIKA